MPIETRPYMGQVSLLKRNTGGGPLANAAQRNLFAVEVMPYNPLNYAYPAGIDASSFPSQLVQGMRSPGISLQACYKPYNSGASNNQYGWGDADLFNSLINVYTNFNTDMFLVALKDDRSSGGYMPGFRYWEWARCESLTFSQDALGGPLMVSMAFKSRWGEQDVTSIPIWAGSPITNPISGEVYPTTPSIATLTTDAGQETNSSQVDFRSGGNAVNGALSLTDVRKWSLTLLRGQTYERYFDGTLYPVEISSKMFSGILEVHQNPRTSTYLTGSGAIQINVATDKIPGKGSFRINTLVNTDHNVLTQSVQAGNLVTTMSLIDTTTGGNPCTITAFT